jgi:hypothetical protein
VAPNIQTPIAATAPAEADRRGANSSSELTAAINQLRENPNAMQQINSNNWPGPI